MRDRKVLQPVLDNVPKKIKCIQFGVHSREDMVKASEVEVSVPETFKFVERERQGTAANGPLDLRMGPSEKTGECNTCGQKLADCPGHFGHLRLVLPLFHVGFFRAIITTLQNICKTCSRVMLEEKDRRAFLKKLRTPMDNMSRQRIIKALNAACRKHVLCPHCKASNGVVKKVGPLKIAHERYRSKKLKEEEEAFRASFQSATAGVPELAPHVGKAMDELHPLRVLELFQAITDEDVELLGLNPEHGRPEHYLWTYLPVPPGVIRPSVARDAEETNEDSLTGKLVEIIYINSLIRRNLAEGQPLSSIMEQWEFMQLTAGLYINSDMPGIPLSMMQSGDAKRHRGLSQRLKGKQGRFRGNLSGKRVDFSGRTVISPDPNMRIDQVAVPEHVAKVLTFPERVTPHNIERLRGLVVNGPDVHPGANYVVEGSSQMKKFLKFGNRHAVARNLRVGDVVERHMQDDDVVLFNRQPSLHKLSIMSHFAKIRPWRTFRFNECVCTPYNADFDGDEMNLHLPQTDEARSEAMELMGVKNNLVTPRNGEPIIAATQDFITASYLLSRKDAFFDRHQFTQMLVFMGNLKFDLPPPAILKPQALWTGKQVLSCLLKPNKKCEIMVNLEAKTRSFVKKDGQTPDLCAHDGWLVIMNSEVMCGVWDKSVVGDGNKDSVFYVVLRDYGPVRAAECMNRLARLCARWLGNQGFSIGIQDVQPGERLTELKDKLVHDGYTECDNFIGKSKAGDLPNEPGCNAEQTLESKISGVLSGIRDKAGQLCMTELNKYNAPLIMSVCGSKGSKINVCQMVACVGQQIISGSRIPDGFDERSLPHFAKRSKVPAAKGFVRNSFYTGLTPTEFFFHAVSGREGLVDTAVKTAETGYMQRRLMKALEDLTAHYDKTVRNSSGGVVQFVYGDDGLDPANIEGDNQPVEFARNLRHAINVARTPAAFDGDQGTALSPDEIATRVFEATETWTTCSDMFVTSLRAFVDAKVVAPLRELLDRADAPGHADNLFHLTREQLEFFLALSQRKYRKALIEPGTAVGAVGAQSIGEPGTQMTLKTFHFAGVASMNVTLGVPRIKEIINAAKVISTPIITAKLESKTQSAAARLVKGRIEKTLLGDVTHYIDVVHAPNGSYLLIDLDLAVISKLALEINLYSICNALLAAKTPKLTMQHLAPQPPNQLRVHSSDLSELHMLKRLLPTVLINGYAAINRAVISNAPGNTYDLLVEGYGLQQVMNTDGVIGTETTSNHVAEVEKVLGIEAARNTIIHEIQYTMGKHGMTIDPRHVMLLADVMTFKGEVLGITRFGVSKMKDSVLMLASFEKTTDHLFDASLYSKRDPVEGVSECIIMGIPMPIGSGIFKLVQKAESKPATRPPLLFDVPEMHAAGRVAVP
ncbi:DNA-directed RNA polymerase III subunit C1 (rpo31) [Blastocladiella emersonii ATCC 22665]|nr:DNA-directed RNA polymerase III subunit C1 (rpo31) [Blastocladiella emersonii ATCC 22665]